MLIAVLIGLFFFRETRKESGNEGFAASTPLTRKLSIANDQARNGIADSKLRDILYRSIPVGTPTAAAISFLSAQGFKINKIASADSKDGATMTASIAFWDDRNFFVKYANYITVKIIESKEGGVPKISEIVAVSYFPSL